MSRYLFSEVIQTWAGDQGFEAKPIEPVQNDVINKMIQMEYGKMQQTCISRYNEMIMSTVTAKHFDELARKPDNKGFIQVREPGAEEPNTYTYDYMGEYHMKHAQELGKANRSDRDNFLEEVWTCQLHDGVSLNHETRDLLGTEYKLFEEKKNAELEKATNELRLSSEKKGFEKGGNEKKPPLRKPNIEDIKGYTGPESDLPY